MERTPIELFTGTGVALVTPFDNSGAVDYPALSRLVEYVKDGVEYLVVLGTTGEATTLTESEKNKVVETVKEANAGALPIVLGLGGNNTQELVNMAKSQNWSGIDAILSVSPYYNKPTQKGLIAHYTALADSVPVPVILYNVPGRTACNMLPPTVLELAEHPNICGIKEASGSLEQALAIAMAKPDDFLLISGDDLLTLPMMTAGAVGAISVIANLMPHTFGSMIREALNQNWIEARAQWFAWASLHDFMYAEGNPVGVKQAMCLIGLCESSVRLPLMSASESLSQSIKAEMEHLGLLQPSLA